MYSQNQEQQVIVNYFKDFKGTLLDLGANDGKTFSNSLYLIENGWKACLVEPSPKAFKKLLTLHKSNSNVSLFNFGIDVVNSYIVLHESGHHLPDKSDIGLLSTLIQKEKLRWRNVKFTETVIDVKTYSSFLKESPIKKFDFISIDLEGMDLMVLKQIDLSDTSLVCLEWNNIESVKQDFLEYLSFYGMTKLIYQSAENLIFIK